MELASGDADVGDYGQRLGHNFGRMEDASSHRQQEKGNRSVQADFDAGDLERVVYSKPGCSRRDRRPAQRPCRRSVDYISVPICPYSQRDRYRSLSDSELDKVSATNLTAEFMDLPDHLTDRSSPLPLHPLYIKPYTQISSSLDGPPSIPDCPSLPSQSDYHDTQHNSLPPSSTTIPRIEFDTAELTLQEDCGTEGFDPSYIPSYSGYDDQLASAAGSQRTSWTFLEGQKPAFLAPGSCNSSVSSIYSSNTDSAIEVLTPDEDVQENQFWKGTSEAQLDENPKRTSVDENTKRTLRTRSINTDSSHSSVQRTKVVDCVPEVVISDCSGSWSHESQVPDAAGPAVFLSTADMEEVCMKLQRSMSGSSISSTDSCSTWSCMSDSSHEVDVDPNDTPRPYKKQSSWKKIRNIVHWSPFIQQFKRRRYPWIQLAGHQGNFQAGEAGSILKKYDSKEYPSFVKLMKDVLRSYIPEYRGQVEKDGNRYLQLQDLLCEFEAPCVMDIKMGCRTYLEEELVKAREKPTLRKDMYKKMVEVDKDAPTPEEHAAGGITKPRYMQWRDDMSSSAELGFRIEGIRKTDGDQVKNFKTTKNKESVKQCLRLFVKGNAAIINKYLRRLKAIRATQEVSPFFQSHEIIGSSLLFVHDKTQASIWMIDFGKTVALPEGIRITHKDKWVEGNHEDGYHFGLDSLVEIFEELHEEFSDSGSAADNTEVKTSETLDKDSIKSSDKDTSDSKTDSKTQAKTKTQSEECSNSKVDTEEDLNVVEVADDESEQITQKNESTV